MSALLAAGHQVRVQTGAAARIGFSDDAYRAAGAQIVADAAAVYEADLIVKVKEPQSAEIPLLRAGQILFGYLHLAADPELTAQLLDKKIIGIGFETVTDASGTAPAGTDVGSRRTHRGAGGRAGADHGERRQRHPAVRRGRRGTRQSRHHRRAAW